MRIRTRLLLSILLTSVIVFAGIIIYLSFNYYNSTLNEAKRTTDIYTRQQSNKFKLLLDKDKKLTSTLAESFADYNYIPDNQWQDIYSNMLLSILKRNQNYLSVWMTWELSSIDSTYTMPYGRMRKAYFREFKKNTRITYGFKIQHDTVELTGHNVNSVYYNAKSNKTGIVTDPYIFTYEGDNTADSFLEVSIASPIIIRNQFAGLVGVDIAIDHFQQLAGKIKPYKNSYAFLISASGNLITHQVDSLINSPLDSVLTISDEKILELKNKINSGEEYSFMYTNQNQSVYYTFQPIKFSQSNNNWSLAVVVPVNEIMKDYSRQLNIIIIVGVAGMLILILVTTILSHNITMPLKVIASELQKLNHADINILQKHKEKYKGEVGYIADAAVTLISWINKTGKFAKNLSNGNYDIDYRLLGENDELGKSLIDLCNKLVKSKEAEQKLRKEEQKNNWINKSIARFAYILRHTSNIDELGDKVITNMVEMLNYQQGVFFIINDKNPEDVYIQLIAAYGVSPERKEIKHFETDEGLLGRCLREEETIIISDVPDKYTKISSGLGKGKPANIIFTPLKYNEKVYGIAELSSIRKFENHEITFIEKVSESIAVAILNTINNLKNARLLRESKHKSEELSEKEEEMRVQNEELMLTHEEMNKKQKELETALKQLEQSKAELEKEKIMNEMKSKQSVKAVRGITEKQLKKTKMKIAKYTDKIKELEQQLNEKEKIIQKLSK